MDKKKTAIEYDTNWKEIVGLYFEDFISFFMPYLHSKINFTAKINFLDKELAELIPEKRKGTRIADKLVKVTMKNKAESLLLIHIEFEASPDKDFPDRMFEYFYRIYDKYKRKIEAIAIFVDNNRAQNPNKLNYKAYKTHFTFTYETCKIIELNENKLLKSTNPFALAALAVKYLHKTAKDNDLRKQFKVELSRLLLEREYEPEKINKLFVFIDNILALPKDLELTFYNEIFENNKKTNNMALTFEHSNLGMALRSKWIDEGIERGIERGKIEGIERGIKKNKWLTAIKSIENGLDVHTIHIITGLLKDEIINLQNDYQRLGNKLIRKIENDKY